MFIFVALILVADHYTNMNDSSVGEEAAEKEETREFAYHAVSKHFYNNLLRFFTEKANSGDIDTRVLNLEREELVCSTKVLENLIRAHWTDVVFDPSFCRRVVRDTLCSYDWNATHHPGFVADRVIPQFLRDDTGLSVKSCLLADKEGWINRIRQWIVATKVVFTHSTRSSHDRSTTGEMRFVSYSPGEDFSLSPPSVPVVYFPCHAIFR